MRAALLALCCYLFVLGSPAGSRAAITVPYSSDESFALSAGVSYESGSLVINSSYPRTVRLVEVDPTDSQVAIRLSQGGAVATDRATVVEQALAYSGDGHRVVAASNGSLFSLIATGDETLAGFGLGLNVSDGELINAGDPLSRPDPHPAFGITATGAAVIGMPQTDIQLTLPGGETVAVDRINQVRGDGQVVLYTPQGSTRTWTDDLGDEYVIEGFSLPIDATGTYTGTVAAVNQDAGDSAIGPGQVVLSVSQSAPAWATSLSVGSEVSVSVATSAPWDTATQVLSGRDLLVAGGHAVPVDPARDGNDTRTVVGIKADGNVILLAVDNGTLKKGLTLGDAASLMLSLGAVDAVNLDGGSSTQLAVRQPGDIGVTRITPALEVKSGIIERPVVNALQIVSTAPDGPLAEVLLDPTQTTMALGQTLELAAKGRDAGLNGVPLDYPSLEWDLSRNGAGVDSDVLAPSATGMTFSPTLTGDYSVTVRAGTLEALAAIQVVDDVTPPTLSGLAVALADAVSVEKASADVSVAFSAVDNVGVNSIEIQRRLGSGRWKSSGITTSGLLSASLSVPFGQRIQFRIRASDAAGNRSAWVTTTGYRISLIDSGNRRIVLHGSWKTKRAASAIGDRFARTRAQGSSAQLSFTGLQVAVVGNRGPSSGQATFQLGNGTPASIGLNDEAMAWRQVLYLSPRSASSTSTSVKVINVSDLAMPSLDIDAFVVLSPAN